MLATRLRRSAVFRKCVAFDMVKQGIQRRSGTQDGLPPAEEQRCRMLRYDVRRAKTVDGAWQENEAWPIRQR